MVLVAVVVGPGSRILPTYTELGCPNARTGNTLHPHCISIDREAPKGLAHGIEGHACVDERAENHVAGGA
jgi:hypothetical protein